jgi:uncharacterized protein YcbX
MNPSSNEVGSLVSRNRYPVKSMMGEEINSSVVSEKGLLGDRQFALIDPSTGKAASPKNPSRWPNIFDFRASARGRCKYRRRVESCRFAKAAVAGRFEATSLVADRGYKKGDSANVRTD